MSKDLLMTKRDCLQLLMGIAEEIERQDSDGKLDVLLFANVLIFATRVVINDEFAKLYRN